MDRIEDSPGHPWIDRVVAVLVVSCAVGFVVFLLRVTPDPRGHGTHVQMGLPPCGWVVQYGKPCPTCGVTTAASHLVHLQPWQALKTQPFGTALAGFGLWLAAVAGFCLVRGRSFLDYLMCLPQVRLFLWGVILLLGSWIYLYLTFPAR